MNRFSGMLMMAIVLFGCAENTTESPAPDLVVLNADLRTVDPITSRAEAFAISAGR